MFKKKKKAKNISKTKTFPSKIIKKSSIKPTVLEEIWAITFLLISIFIGLSYFSPQSTGAVGYWIVEQALKTLLGKTVMFLPAFFIFYAISLLFCNSRNRFKVSITALIFSILSFTIFIELLTNTQLDKIVWPIDKNTGGLLGNAGGYLFMRASSFYGSILILSGIFIISVLLIFNFSIQSIIIKLFHLIRDKKTTVSSEEILEEEPLLTHLNPSFIQKLKWFLFYKKKKPDFNHLRPLPTSKPAIPINFPEEIIPNHSLVEPENQQEKIKEHSSKTIKLPAFKQTESSKTYTFPPLHLLEKAKKISLNSKSKALQEQSSLLEETLISFGVNAKVINVTAGPAVTRYELKPGMGVKIAKITSLSKDIALKLAASDIRIEAPIPGKALIGIEVPNPKTEMVTLQNIIEKTDFLTNPSKLICALGLTITGEAISMNLEKMPHLLVAGATGSGKSVCMNAIIISILMRATPDEVKFLMIDPKKVEFSLYNGIPHLISPVVTDPHKAAATLKKWALTEMEQRYELFSKVGVKNIEGYNKKVEELLDLNSKNAEEAQKQIKAFTGYQPTENEESENTIVPLPKKIPYIIVMIDELADLMMVASQEVENTICRLAQMARATGIHLVIATQRPSVNVITGLIKANIPSRISFFLQSQIDSRTILDSPGAEKLLGRGDMLYFPVGSFKPSRLQGIYVSEKEVKNVVSFLKKQAKPQYLEEIIDVEPLETPSKSDSNKNNDDELYQEAINIIRSTQYASTSYLQRKLRIGYNRAARIMDDLEEQGLIKRDEKARATVIGA